MYVIILIYLIAPFLSKILRYFSVTKIISFTFIIVVVLFTSTKIKSLFNNKLIDFHMPSIHYIVYFIFGYLIYKKRLFNNVKLKNLILGFCIFFLSTLFVQIYLKASGNLEPENEGATWYTSFFILILSAITFLIFKKLRDIKDIKNLLALNSKYSFGIYLFHLIPLLVSANFIYPLDINYLLKAISCIVFAYLSSFCFVATFSRLPFLNKLVI